MTGKNRRAAALWLLAAAAALAASPTWAASLQKGMVSPWALVAFFWGVAGLSVAIHHLSQGPQALKRHRLSLAAAGWPGWSLRRRAWRPALAVASHRLASGLAVMRHRLAAQLEPIAGMMAACLQVVAAWVQRSHPVAVGPDAAAEALGKRLELVGQVKPA